MARVERTRGGWHIANRLILPYHSQTSNIADSLRTGFLGEQLAALRNRPLPSRHDCVCVLPVCATDFRSVEVPQGSTSEVEQMALEALRDCYPDDFSRREMRLWRHTESPHGLTQVSGISIPSELGESVVDELEGVGLACTSVTALPFSLCHAVSMAPNGCDLSQPVGIVSWNHSSAIFVVARNGRSEFIRALRDCDGKNALQRIRDGLSLDESEARSVLASCGLPAAAECGSSASLAAKVEQLLQPEVQKIAAEVQKTLIYLRHHLSALMPSQLLLFGGMATVPNISRVMEDAIGMTSQPWSLGADNSHASDAAFASAMSASTGGLE